MTAPEPVPPTGAPDPGAPDPVAPGPAAPGPGPHGPGAPDLGAPAPAAHQPADQPWAPVWAAPASERTSAGPGAPPSAGAAAPSSGPAWSAGSAPEPPRRRWPWVAGALALVLVLAGGTALAVTGVRAVVDAVGGGSFSEVEDGETYGDDPVLDGMWDACEDGDGGACDDLYESSDLGTEYEDFGYTCGDRYTGASAPWSCAGEELEPVVPVRDGLRRGDDAVLDRLWDGCEAGDGVACDELHASAEEGSEYQEFGLTCGERYSALRPPDFCAEALA